MSIRPTFAPLALALAAAGLASLAAGQDANWDLLNYHLYNPWAWLTGRYGFDVVPAHLQTFHAPLADVPFYLMVAGDWPPRAIAFAQALPAGVAAYFVYRLARLAFDDLERPLAVTAIAAAVIVGVTGPNARSLIGTTMNEWHAAAPLLAALFLLARDVKAGSVRASTLVLAGALAALACALKLTAAGGALALAIALGFARGLRRGSVEALVFVCAMLAGVVLLLGPWLAQTYALTGNPLFPYFNGVFASPWLPADWTFDKAFGPRTPVQWLTLPFDLLRPPQGYVSEQRYRDARFPLVAALSLVALLAPPLLRALGREGPRSPFGAGPGAPALLRFGGAFFAVAFVLWAWLHAIHRYLLTLEVLSGIMLVALVVALVPQRARIVAVVALAVVVVATTRAPNWWRVPFGERFVAVTAPPIAADALVLVHGAPLAFVLPSLPPGVRFAGIAGLVDERDSGLRRHISALLAEHRGALHVLLVRGTDPAPALASFGLAVSGPCAPVTTNLARFAIDLCPAARR